MFNFKETFPSPKERTPGINSKKYICIHHTGTGEGTIKGVLDGLYRRADYASCHFVVDTNGDAYKIGSPDDILWHCGQSSWGKLTDMNPHSLGIEIIGPLKDGGFTDAERKTVRNLIQHLMAVFGIPKENVLRHAEIAPKRKWDVAPSFYKEYGTWEKFQNSLIPKQM